MSLFECLFICCIPTREELAKQERIANHKNILSNLIIKYKFDETEDNLYQVSSYKLQTGPDKQNLGIILKYQDDYLNENNFYQKLYLNILFSDVLNSLSGRLDNQLLSRLYITYPRLNNDWKILFDSIINSPTFSAKLGYYVHGNKVLRNYFLNEVKG